MDLKRAQFFEALQSKGTPSTEVLVRAQSCRPKTSLLEKNTFDRGITECKHVVGQRREVRTIGALKSKGASSTEAALVNKRVVDLTSTRGRGEMRFVKPGM